MVFKIEINIFQEFDREITKNFQKVLRLNFFNLKKLFDVYLENEYV